MVCVCVCVFLGIEPKIMCSIGKCSNNKPPYTLSSGFKQVIKRERERPTCKRELVHICSALLLDVRG